MKISFISFGCKVNQAEINSLIKELEGYKVSVELNPIKADIAVINTCAVTEKAQKEGEKYLSGLKNKNKDLKVIATGCLAELMKDRLKDLGIDIIVPNKNKKGILELLDLEKSSKPFIYKRHTRAFVKIQDGCGRYCSYCIIPFLRGKPTSLTEDQVIDSIKEKVAEGYKEIVLTGIHIGLFGKDRGDSSLTTLLEKILLIDGDFRIRLTSLYILEFDHALIEIINRSQGKIVPHFHISLQSASLEILKSMNRSYTPLDFLSLVKDIRSVLPDSFIGVDLIVGFPGETDDLFNETRDFLSNLPLDLQLDGMHIFPYSRRPGTPAADSKLQVPAKLKQDRVNELRKISEVQTLNRKSRMIGRQARVLAEKGGKGHSDNFFLVQLPIKNIVQNSFYDVIITGISDKCLTCDIIS